MIDQRIKDISIAIREIQAIAKGCIRFDIGQPDFKTPEHVKSAAKHAIDDDFILYTPTKGIPDLRQEIARYESKKGRKFTEDNVIVTDGAMGSLTNLLLSLRPGSEVLLMKPYFPPYMAMMSITRCKPVICDLSDFEGKMDENTSCIIINSPRNPDGRVFNKDEIKRIAEAAEKHDISIVSDEVYDRLVYETEAPSISKIYEKTFIVNSLSKTHAMTGFRIGWLVGPAEAVNHVAKVNGTVNASVNSISQMAALAALRGPQEHVEAMRKEYKSRRDLVMRRIDGLGWTYKKPEGSIYIFPKISQDSWSFAMRLIKEAKVSTVPGKAFGCEGHLRLCFGSVDKENINTGFDRIKRLLG